jgi:hypothetical protein
MGSCPRSIRNRSWARRLATHGGRWRESSVIDVNSLPGDSSVLTSHQHGPRLRGGAPGARPLVDERLALDVTEADAHTLELGLQQVAEDTGGFYERAYTSPIGAVDRIANAIAGYYVLSFDKPPGPAGAHKVDVSLVGRKGTVLARNGYVD